MNKFMRILVFFDLPVKTKTQRREATRFRNFLLTDGYHMLQYSVYARVCNGIDAVEKHRQRVKQNLPANVRTPLCKISSTGEIEQRFRLN